MTLKNKRRGAAVKPGHTFCRRLEKSRVGSEKRDEHRGSLDIKKGRGIIPSPRKSHCSRLGSRPCGGSSHAQGSRNFFMPETCRQENEYHGKNNPLFLKRISLETCRHSGEPELMPKSESNSGSGSSYWAKATVLSMKCPMFIRSSPYFAFVAGDSLRNPLDIRPLSGVIKNVFIKMSQSFSGCFFLLRRTYVCPPHMTLDSRNAWNAFFA